MTCKALLISELKARRQALGWSLAEVGERCGIEECSLDDWEHGVSWPRLDAVDAWVTALGLKLAVTLEGAAPRRGLHVDWGNRHISVDGTTVRLTPMEWKALERLAAVPGELVTHQALFCHLYGDGRSYSAQSTAIRVLITKLRRLLPLRIEAQWGRGYVLTDLPASSPEQPSRTEHDARLSARPTAASRPVPLPQTRDRVLSTPPRPARLLEDFGERNQPAIHRPAAAPTRFLPHRAEELQVIERFLAERGATRCPDVATIERDPLPTLVWDKIKRKWVRPNGEAAAAR